MAGKQRRERERDRRAEALAQSIDKLVFLGEVDVQKPSGVDKPKPQDAGEGDVE